MELLSEFETNGEGKKHTCDPDDFDDVLDGLIDEPAVGLEVPFDGLSLPDDVNVEPTAREIRDAATGVTPAGLGVASYGNVTVESESVSELVALYSDAQVAVLRESDIVPDMDTAFDGMGDRIAEAHNSHILVSGPSATGDMGTLVQGVHGPEELDVVVLEGM
jgi:L-lactate dehydrogenase complex protein LldG